jgi:hypothetical protein
LKWHQYWDSIEEYSAVLSSGLPCCPVPVGSPITRRLRSRYPWYTVRQNTKQKIGGNKRKETTNTIRRGRKDALTSSCNECLVQTREACPSDSSKVSYAPNARGAVALVVMRQLRRLIGLERRRKGTSLTPRWIIKGQCKYGAMRHSSVSSGESSKSSTVWWMWCWFAKVHGTWLVGGIEASIYVVVWPISRSSSRHCRESATATANPHDLWLPQQG